MRTTNAPAARTIRTKIRGDSHRNDDGTKRQTIIRKYCRDGMSVIVVPEPRNKHDRNALGLWIQTRRWYLFKRVYQVGYISAELAAELKPELKKGATITARILDVTGGGWFKNYGVNVELTIAP